MLKIRRVELADAEALASIYKPFVESEDRNVSDVSFEYVAPTVEEFGERIKHISANYPYLVAELDGKPVGYAYAHPYIERAAYQWGAEVTIYLAPAGQGHGYGVRLYRVLEALLKKQGVLTLYSCITGSNEHSIMMHRSMGYEIIGDFKQSGFKHGHWLDMVWMAKSLGEYPRQPEPIKFVQKLTDKDWYEALKVE